VRRHVLSAAALVAVAGGAAVIVLWVGGVFDGGQNKTDTLTRSAYVAQLQRLCREASRKLSQVPAPAGANPQAIANSIEQALPVLRQAVTDEEKLEPPKELEAQAKRAFELSEQSVQALEESRSKAKAGDAPGALKALAKFEQVRDRARQAGIALGLQC
jgi:homospermidine synthase